MAGRPRKTLAELTATGAIHVNPGRYADRINEPKAEDIGPIGDAPDYFDAFQKQCWDDIVKTAIPGSICASDRLWVEQGAQLLTQLRIEKWCCPAPVIGAFSKFLQDMGMNPANRHRVTATLKAPETYDPEDEFAFGTPH